jgi:nucleotide-binding universal stress UspA family protein
MKAESPLPSVPLRDEPAPTRHGFARVLVPIDFSKPSLKALHYARALTTGTVELIHVVEPLNPTDFPPTDLQDTMLRTADDELNAIAALLGKGKPEVRTSVHLGKPAARIANLAAEWGAELIVISTHARAGLAHFLLGSVTEQVIREATCPVLAIRKHEHEFAIASPKHEVEVQLSRILVATDFSTRSAEAVQYAADFASRLAGRITLLHAVHIAGSGAGGEIPGFDMAPMLDATERRAHASMETAAKEVPASLLGGRIVQVGPPLEVITKTAVEGKFDLIICATNSSAVVRHALLGSTAEGVVRHAYCPVLIVPSRVGFGKAQAAAAKNVETEKG